MREKYRLSLFALNGVGVIIKHPTGVVYSNQTGGVYCLQPEMEGMFLPLNTDQLPQNFHEGNMHALMSLDWVRHDRVTPELADQIDAILSRSLFSRGILVDRTKLNDSHEAWVHVTLSRGEECGVYEEGPAGKEGVLTWVNSD